MKYLLAALFLVGCRWGFDPAASTGSDGDGGAGSDGGTGMPLVAPLSLSASDSGACAVMGDHTLWCWGDNFAFAFGGTNRTVWTPVQIGTDADWLEVATTYDHTCARKQNGTLWCWGAAEVLGTGDAIEHAIPAQIGSATDWQAMTAGRYGGCAIRAGGALYCWGRNGYGALGDGSPSSGTATLAPVHIAAGQTFKAVTSHGEHVCALELDGSLWCWGLGFYGQLGNGTSTQDNLLPLHIGTDHWLSISTGQYETCGVRDDGTLWQWGLFVGNVPQQIGTQTGFTAAACGDDFDFTQHTCGLRGQGELWCVGRNKKGQFGSAITVDVPATAPVQIDPTHTFTMLAAGQATTCATRDDVIACTGLGNTGQLGDGPRASSVPAFLPGTWTTLDAGVSFVSAVAAAGTLHGWGANSDGEVGMPQLYGAQAPRLLDAGTAWTSVRSTQMGSLIRKTDGTLWRIGAQFVMQGSWSTYSTPVQIGTATTWVATDGGAWHDCGVQTDGSLWCWGVNNEGELGTNNTTASPTPVKVSAANQFYSAVGAGYESSCAIRSNGTLWCWGNNGAGQLGDGTTTPHLSPTQAGTATTWQQISVGLNRACGIQTDKSLWCWGQSIGDGTTATVFTPTKIGTAQWTQIAAGVSHTCGVQQDGSLWCWGYNYAGQIGDGTRIDRTAQTQVGAGTVWKEVHVGWAFTCAIAADGRAACWGDNADGQLGTGDAWTTAFQAVTH